MKNKAHTCTWTWCYTSPSPHFITEFAHPGHIDLVRCPPRHLVSGPIIIIYMHYLVLFFFLSFLGHLCSIIRPWSWHSMWGMRRASNYIYNNTWLVCRVLSLWHSATSLFAECPIKSTRQSMGHSAKKPSPVVYYAGLFRPKWKQRITWSKNICIRYSVLLFMSMGE